MDAAHVEWCRNMFRSLADRGTWGVPRSGLVFQKQGDELVLTSQMPWMAGIPMTPEELAEYQREDYETIQGYFGAAGVTVRKSDP